MIHKAAHDAAIIGEDIGDVTGGIVAVFNFALELRIVSPLVTPNLNSNEAVAKERFLASSLPVPRFAFTRVAISFAMSSSEQGVPMLGNMLSNLEVMVDTVRGGDESTGAGVERTPVGTWE